MENEKDTKLWETAKMRSAFKQHVLLYCVINLVCLFVWYFTIGPDGYFWPKWGMLGWGIAIVIHYFTVYHAAHVFSAEEEYKRLKESNTNPH